MNFRGTTYGLQTYVLYYILTQLLRIVKLIALDKLKFHYIKKM